MPGLQCCPSCSADLFAGWRKSHLHCEDESSAVEGIFSVQGPIQGQSSADVVQCKDAVGVT